MPIRRKPLASDASLGPGRPSVQDVLPTAVRHHQVNEARPSLYQFGTNERQLIDRTRGLTLDVPPKYADTHTTDVTTSKRSQDSIIQDPIHTVPYLSNSAAVPEGVPVTNSSVEWTPAVEANAPIYTDRTSSINPTENDIDARPQPLHNNKPERKTKVASALQDASVFLGGLIKHPTESTKHFTILRHSHGLVYYKGPSTSIAITVFADQPLPPDRRYWLQMKGWTGHTGMRAKALMRTNGNWINVTPTIKAASAELPPMDERAWQRDIRRFLNKAPKHLQKHTERETAVVRVPSEAIDGYFRIVLTGADSRYPLCPSPVFRVASTSMSAGSIKGASLSTLPLELSVSMLQFAAKTVASNVVTPFAETARSQIASVLPSAVSSYGQTAYGFSGAQEQVDSLNQEYNDRRDLITEQSRQGGGDSYIPMSRPDCVGIDEGPDLPFPIRFDSKVVRGSGIGHREVGMPTANLSNAPPDALVTLNGVYFGWALVTQNDKAERELHSDWRHAIITITHDHAMTSVAAKKIVRAYLLHDFAGHEFYDAKMSLVVMGYLRPVITYKHKEAFFSETVRDVEITRMSLDREQWGPIPTLQRIKTAKSERSFTERYVDNRIALQRRVDAVPIHRLGVRNQSFVLNDRGLYGNGGLYVTRDIF